MGTLRSTFKIGKATLDTSGLSVARSITVPDKAGTLAMTSDTAAKATILATPRAIYGNNFDGSAALTGIIDSTYGGTGNGFAKFTGPTTSEKTFTLPDATASLAILAANTFTAYQTLAENAAIALDPALSADGKYTGIVQAGVAAAALAFGELCYKVTATGRWNKASGAAAGVDTVVATGQLGICVLAAAGDEAATTMLMYGNVRADSLFDTFTVGAPVYMSAATAGKIVTAAPTGTTDFTVRKVGFAEDGNTVFFNPSPDYCTLV